MNPSSFKIAFKHKEIRLFMSKDKKREPKIHFHFQELGVCWVIRGFFGKKKLIQGFPKNQVNNSNNSHTYKENNIICWPNAIAGHAEDQKSPFKMLRYF